MQLQHRRGIHRGDGAFDRLGDGAGFFRAERQQQILPRFHDRADAHRDAVMRHGGFAPEKPGVIFARLLRERLDARPRGERG